MEYTVTVDNRFSQNMPLFVAASQSQEPTVKLSVCRGCRGNYSSCHTALTMFCFVFEFTYQ
jgi:hypothetical protein